MATIEIFVFFADEGVVFVVLVVLVAVFFSKKNGLPNFLATIVKP